MQVAQRPARMQTWLTNNHAKLRDFEANKINLGSVSISLVIPCIMFDGRCQLADNTKECAVNESQPVGSDLSRLAGNYIHLCFGLIYTKVGRLQPPLYH